MINAIVTSATRYSRYIPSISIGGKTVNVYTPSEGEFTYFLFGRLLGYPLTMGSAKATTRSSYFRSTDPLFQFHRSNWQSFVNTAFRDRRFSSAIAYILLRPDVKNKNWFYNAGLAGKSS